jgi:hypothetical protein
MSLLLPDEIVEDADPNVASYWKPHDTCLLQLSSFVRDQGPQISAMQRLSERTRVGGNWEPVDVSFTIEGCDVAAASTQDDEATSWVHVYLVWEWVAVHATVSRKGEVSYCDWAWNALNSVRPVTM